MARKRLGELLVEAGVIDEHQLRAALGEHRKWGRPLGATLVEMGVIDERTLVSALSSQLNLPAVDVGLLRIPRAVLDLLGVEFCKQHGCLPFRHDRHRSFLDVAMVDPTNAELYDLIRVKTRCNLRPHLAGPRAIARALRASTEADALDLAPPAPGMPGWSPEPGAGDGPVELPDEELLVSPAAGAGPGRGALPEGEDLHAEVARLREEVEALQDLLVRDEQVLRRLLSLLVDAGVFTREELIARINED